MTKQQKKDILEVLEAFPVVLEELEANWKTSRQSAIQNEMADMQDFLSNIQIILSEEETAEDEINSIIEKMYILLYQLNQSLECGKEPENLFDELNRQVLLTIRKIKEIPCKWEILFLPYKVSMWDCMESIWEASNSDANCISCVVPIPYYERVGDSLLPQYEGKLFPQNVPVIPYWEYDIEVHHPDVIVIHNPYDDYNFVTQVDEKYFSRELKKHTSLLVYVPYFITTPSIMPKSHIDLPAYKYADLIIVQDEKIKEKFPEEVGTEKLLVMGSPKIDRILREQGRREEMIEKEISQDWRKKIKGKKVFFYNVSLTGVLENKQKFINKLEYVFTRFKNRNDSVLIWRPHPLLEATLKAMCPQLYPEYMRLKDSFLQSSFGILDDSPDNIKSVVIADAYIGEETSSMIHYFGILGKPVFCVEWDITSEKTWEERCRLPSAYTEFGDKECIFSPFDFGKGPVLWKMDYNTGRLSYIMKVPGMEVKLFAYRGIAYIREYEIYAPCTASDVYIYNSKKDQGIKLPLREKCRFPYFNDAVAYNGKAYLIPNGYHAIVKVDPQTNEYREYTEFTELIPEEVRGNELFAWHTCVGINNILYLFSAYSDTIILFHTDNERAERMNPGGCREGYVYTVRDCNMIWMAGRDGNLYQYNTECRKMEVINLHWTKAEGTGMCTIAATPEKIYIFNLKSDRMAILDKKSGMIGFQNINVEYGESLAALSVVEDKYIYLINMSENILFEYQIPKGIFRSWKCSFGHNETLKLEESRINETMTSNGIPYRISEIEIGMTEFIDYMAEGGIRLFQDEGEIYNGGTPGMDGSSGRRIYQYIRDRIEQNNVRVTEACG